jgi:hypothetical protein
MVPTMPFEVAVTECYDLIARLLPVSSTFATVQICAFPLKKAQIGYSTHLSNIYSLRSSPVCKSVFIFALQTQILIVLCPAML